MVGFLAVKASKLIKDYARQFRDSANTELTSLSHAADQAGELLDFALKREHDAEENLSASVLRRFEALAARRRSGEPVSYITKSIEFCDLKLYVDPRAFIPRATTEFLATTASKRLRARKTGIGIDVATGAGAIALTMAARAVNAKVWGTDISAPAIAVARKNAKLLKLANARFAIGDMLDSLPTSLHGDVDVITMHPPYVPRGEVKLLPKEIGKFEPKVSLSDNSKDGMRLITRVISESPEWLKPKGWLLMEVHPADTRKVQTLMRRNGFSDIQKLKGDLPYTRVVTARRGAD